MVPFDEGAMVVFAEGAMVPFDEGAMAPFAGPLVRQIRVGRVARGFLYTCEDDGGLLWKCARASDFGEQRWGNVVLYLVWSPNDGYWYAIEEVADVAGGASAILQSGHRIYRTKNSAVVGGRSYWEVNRSENGRLEA